MKKLNGNVDFIIKSRIYMKAKIVHSVPIVKSSSIKIRNFGCIRALLINLNRKDEEDFFIFFHERDESITRVTNFSGRLIFFSENY